MPNEVWPWVTLGGKSTSDLHCQCVGPESLGPACALGSRWLGLGVWPSERSLDDEGTEARTTDAAAHGHSSARVLKRPPPHVPGFIAYLISLGPPELLRGLGTTRDILNCWSPPAWSWSRDEAQSRCSHSLILRGPWGHQPQGISTLPAEKLLWCFSESLADRDWLWEEEQPGRCSGVEGARTQLPTLPPAEYRGVTVWPHPKARGGPEVHAPGNVLLFWTWTWMGHCSLLPYSWLPLLEFRKKLFSRISEMLGPTHGQGLRGAPR